MSFTYWCDWDSAKNDANRLKHGLEFDRAEEVFRDRHGISIFDAEHSSEEDRWITIGLDLSGVLLVVVHTFEQETAVGAQVRIISARKASKNEIQLYNERSGQ